MSLWIRIMNGIRFMRLGLLSGRCRNATMPEGSSGLFLSYFPICIVDLHVVLHDFKYYSKLLLSYQRIRLNRTTD